jgi:hypothetical protein
MIRAFVCCLTMVGAILLSLIFIPSTANIAFEVGKVGIKWFYMIGLASGYAAYRITK